MSPSDLLDRFIQWFSNSFSDKAFGQILVERATYDVGIDDLGIEYFVWQTEGGVGFRDFQLLEKFSTSSGGSFLFSGVSLVTLLPTRGAFFAFIGEDGAIRIRHLHMNLMP